MPDYSLRWDIPLKVNIGLMARASRRRELVPPLKLSFYPFTYHHTNLFAPLDHVDHLNRSIKPSI